MRGTPNKDLGMQDVQVLFRRQELFGWAASVIWTGGKSYLVARQELFGRATSYLAGRQELFGWERVIWAQQFPHSPPPPPPHPFARGWLVRATRSKSALDYKTVVYRAKRRKCTGVWGETCLSPVSLTVSTLTRSEDRARSKIYITVLESKSARKH